MPRGDKSSYTSKQKRMAEHIEEGYEKRGVGNRESARRAWATVNKETGGGRKRSPARKRKSCFHHRAGLLERERPLEEEFDYDPRPQSNFTTFNVGPHDDSTSDQSAQEVAGFPLRRSLLPGF